MREPPLVKVQVARGTQLSFDGESFPSGAEIEAPEAIAARWVTRGWAEPSDSTPPPSKAPSRSRRTR